MNSRSLNKPNLFVLEDSIELAKDVTRMGERLGWRLIIARSLEGATQLCQENGKDIHAALIDLMVPLTEFKLREIDVLLEQRTCASMTLIGRGGKTETVLKEIHKSNSEIDSIDKQIMARINDDVGVQFLSWASDKSMFKKTQVAIFTARQDGSVKASGRKTLESVVEKAFGRRVERWFPKPVLALDLEVWLEEMKTGVGTMPQR